MTYRQLTVDEAIKLIDDIREDYNVVQGQFTDGRPIIINPLECSGSLRNQGKVGICVLCSLMEIKKVLKSVRSQDDSSV